MVKQLSICAIGHTKRSQALKEKNCQALDRNPGVVVCFFLGRVERFDPSHLQAFYALYECVGRHFADSLPRPKCQCGGDGWYFQCKQC